MNGLGVYGEDSIYIEGAEIAGWPILPGTALAGGDLIPRGRELSPLSGGTLLESSDLTAVLEETEETGQEIIDDILGLLDLDPPVIEAALANDTGISNTDALTGDPTINITVTDANAIDSVLAGFGDTSVEDYLEISGSFDQNGNAILDKAAIEKILANRLVSPGSYELRLIATDDRGNTSKTFTVSFEYDNTAPELNLLTPLADGNHSNTARLIGSATDSGAIANAYYSLDGGELSSIPIAGDGSFDLALGNLSLSNHQITVQIEDAAGNETASTIDFAVTDDFTVGATGSSGWGAANSETIIISDRDSFFSTAAIPVELGLSSGSRTLQFQLETSSNSADTFQVFLVKTSDPEQTLLDGGQPGTAVFSLTGKTAEFVPGLVRYDGSTVSIDLSSLDSETSGQLLVKAINSAPDTASLFQVKSLTNIADPEGFVGPVFPVQLQPLSPGPAIDTSGFSSSSSLEIILGQIRLDEATGNYTANLQVRNNGEAIGRNVAVSFLDLPAGISIQNASGIDGNGNPYINLRNSIDPSGLDVGETSAPVEIILSNPDLLQFSLTGEVLVGGANSAPQFEAVGSLSVMPGSKLEVPLTATDPDGETVTFQIEADRTLPTGKLSGNGTLVFTPTPEEIGTYTFKLIATDSSATTTQEVTLTVEPDPINTTRVSGTILNTNKEPLAGVVLELGGLLAVTGADGTFTIEADGPLPDDTLKVRGEKIPGSITYPFIAEKLPLVLERDTYEGYNNVISRPIYLPPIDTANAQTIDPNADVTVTTAAIPGASVEVAAGSLLDQEGNPYTGELSITAVPNDLTPAALPPNLSPDLVVTIQPGEMEFTTPAPLNLPNLAGYAPGTEMDLWSINPVTGEFDNVGTGRVSADGSIVETISGGIRNSSWHFVAVPPNEPTDNPRNPDDRCEECKASEDFTSSVELHSGAVTETHNLVPYQSKGANRSLNLTYDSLRADPRPIVHIGYENLPFWGFGVNVVSDLTISRGSFEYQVPGSEEYLGLAEGKHFWSIPSEEELINIALSADMRLLPSGHYDYEMNSGMYLFGGNGFLGSATELRGKLLHVNSIESAWGAGWGLAGLQEIIENPDGSVLLVDGDGSELLFEAPTDGGNIYVSPPGDFSTLERQADGTFSRSLKDETVYRFDDSNKLSTMQEANGDETQYLYNGAGQLEKIIDPANLETTFSYTNGKVTAIVDPANRTTILSYDSAGNLTRIIDPDSSARTFGYDSQHHITSEIDKRGSLEQTFYDFAGRAKSAIRKDGTELMVAPVQVQGLYRPEETIVKDPFNAPAVVPVGAARSSAADASGNVVESTLDAAGQTVNSFDSSGFLPSVKRNEENLVTERASGRGRLTSLEYDSLGNVISIADEISGEGETPGEGESEPIFAPGPDLAVGSLPADVATGDINGDGNPDLVTANQIDDTVSVLLSAGDGSFFPPVTVVTGLAPEGVALGDLNKDDNLDLVASFRGDDAVSILLGNGDGTFGQALNYAVGSEPAAISVGDLDNNGNLDLAVANNNEDSVSILLGNGDGSMGAETKVVGEGLSPMLANGQIPTGAAHVTLADLDADSDEELILSGYGYGVDRILIHRGNGDGTFGEGVSYQAGAEVVEAVAVDANSDGNLDLVTANFDENNPANNGASVLLGNGDRTFQPKVDYATGLSPTGVGASDLDGDGDSDIVLSGNGFGSEDFVEVFLNDGDGNLSSSETVTVGSNPGAVELADLNNDGSPDLVTANRDSDTISIRLNASNSPSTGKGPKRFTYDPKFNKVTSFTDEEGRQTFYEIDQVTGNVLSVTRVVGEVGGGDDVVTSYTYTDENLVDVETDPLGVKTDYDYDDRGNLVQIVFAVGTADEAVQRFEYDAAGNQTAFIDENGNRTEYEYDELNRLVKVIFAAGTADEAFQQFEYDGAGNRTAFVDENGNRTEYEYDEMNRLVLTIEPDPDGAGPLEAPVIRTEYDKNGNRSAIVDALGRRTEYRYDARDRLVETIDPEGNVTETRYDFDNNLISVIDQNGNRTNFVYDARSRLIREVDALGNIIVYEYDAADNLTAKTDRNNRRTELEYDDLSRLVAETWVGGNQTFSTSYDKAGNVLEVSDNFSNLAFTYDARDRLITADNTGTPGAPSVLLEYAYDDAGNVVSVTDSISGLLAGTNSYIYDARDRLTRLQQSGSGITDKRVDFTYNNLGQFASIQRYAEGSEVGTTAYSYDSLNRLTGLEHLNPAGDKISFEELEYDIASRITQITDIDGVTSYSYDSRDQLTGATHSDSNNPDESYGYDANGNRINSSLHGDGYETGPNNRLSSDGTYNYDYDNEGNLIRRTEIATGASRELEWDYRNRLVSVVELNSSGAITQRVEYSYDAYGRRISKAVDGVVTHFVHDRDDVLLDFVDSDGTAGSQQPILDKRYLHGPVVDQVLAQEDGSGNTAWHLTDRLGTARDLADNNGDVVNHFTFDSFGNLVSQTNSAIDTRYLFTGREFDPETGLYNYRSRYYDGAIGRFISEDPIGFAGWDANLYRYVVNRPTDLIDPSGLQYVRLNIVNQNYYNSWTISPVALPTTANSPRPIIAPPTSTIFSITCSLDAPPEPNNNYIRAEGNAAPFPSLPGLGIAAAKSVNLNNGSVRDEIGISFSLSGDLVSGYFAGFTERIWAPFSQ